MPTEPSINDLISLALTQDPDEEAYWDTVWALRKRVNRETVDAAHELCSGASWQERALGANILAQLGAGTADVLPFLEDSLPLLISMLNDPANEIPELRDTLICSLGHQHDVRAVESIVRYKAHPDVDTRYNVAVALGGRDDDVSVAALIELSADPDDNVRDWATFGFGTQCDNDTPAIRQALLARLNDPHYDTRCEAIKGLAKRGDERALEAIQAELQTGNPGGLVVDAACDLAHPALLPALLKLKSADDEAGRTDETLLEAIEKSQSKLK